MGLCIEAAATGLLDFSRARPRDPIWQGHYRLKLDWLARQKNLQVARLEHETLLAVVSRGGLDEFGQDNLSRGVQRAQRDILNQLRPWSAMSEGQQKALEAASARSEYEAAFGVKIDSEEFREFERRKIMESEKLREQAVSQSDESLFDRIRRHREQIAKNKADPA